MGRRAKGEGSLYKTIQKQKDRNLQLMENVLYVVNARIELLAIIDKVMRNAKSVKTVKRNV